MTDSTTGRRGWVAPLLWSAVACEGFDIVVIGVVLGPLIRDTDWGLTPATGALMATLGRRVDTHDDFVAALDEVVPTLGHHTEPVLLEVTVAPVTGFEP